MSKPNKKFIWNDEEHGAQDSAIESIKSIADEHGIEVFNTGGMEFFDLIDGLNMKPSDFTVAEFEEWKSEVVSQVLEALCNAERVAFANIILKKKTKKSV